MKIATVRTFEEAADVVIHVWEEAGGPKLLRFDGFDGVGKTRLAKLIAPQIGAVHIEGDAFAFKPEAPTPYWGCLRMDELEAAIAEAVGSAKPVILDAVCLDKVAPSSRWGRGFVIYVKRLSFNNQDPIWHDGLYLEDDGQENHSDEPHRGILQYHQWSKPHERADLIIEFPDSGHTIYNFAFDRSLCLDPAGAEVLAHGRSKDHDT